jgi:hypothetical protein
MSTIPDLMVHCLAALSRSTAVALALIVRGLIEKGWDITNIDLLAERAVAVLLQIRPKARPNVLVLKLCLEQFLDPAKAQDLTIRMLNHPILMENRFVRPREAGEERGP